MKIPLFNPCSRDIYVSILRNIITQPPVKHHFMACKKIEHYRVHGFGSTERLAELAIEDKITALEELEKKAAADCIKETCSEGDGFKCVFVKLDYGYRDADGFPEKYRLYFPPQHSVTTVERPIYQKYKDVYFICKCQNSDIYQADLDKSNRITLDGGKCLKLVQPDDSMLLTADDPYSAEEAKSKLEKIIEKHLEVYKKKCEEHNCGNEVCLFGYRLSPGQPDVNLQRGPEESKYVAKQTLHLLCICRKYVEQSGIVR
jgi:hypothetical protein